MIKKTIALLLLIAAVYWSFFAMLPNKISDIDTDENSFSTARALVHLKEISKAPHYVGSPEHANVRNYLIQQLEALGLETQIQESYSMTDWGNLSKPKNIIARIPGTDNTKALLLLSHYDSAPQASLGASDDGSGIVTILEGLRAFLNDGKTPKNDIIILFTDAEELGLNGADTFVNQHPWAKDVGLVLNFEARGSGGASYMLMETNGGNAAMMKGFIAANPQYPVTNSLAYSIYKSLPNDTDLTVFRRDADIEGFNFAFIDDHFDYHTSNDSYERLDRNTLEHQGSYLMPMLHYFSAADLSNLKSDADYIYFNVPLLKMVSYPFAWIWPMLILALVIFMGLLFFGIFRGRLVVKDILMGFLPFLSTLILGGFSTYYLWKLLQWIYPQYGEILHGFTYNGHTYILAFVFLTLGICFWFYHKFYKKENTGSLLVAPITIWLIICILVGFKLKGASFFIIPVYFGLLALFVLLRQKTPNVSLMALLSFPLLLILAPFIKMLPVGLGLKNLFIVGVLGALIFGLLIPVFGFFKHKNRWAYLMFFLSFCLLISAHFKSDFDAESPKPNSLVYVLNADENSAIWATYDTVLDDWTKQFLGDTPNDARQLSNNTLASKYNSGFSYTKATDVKAIPTSEVDIYKDTVIGDLRHVSMNVKQQRNINRLDVFSDAEYVFKDFKVNGVASFKESETSNAFEKRRRNRLFSYFVSDNDSLNLEFTIPKNQETKLLLFESSFDLLSNPLFSIPERTEAMIPKPFILNDAVIITKTIHIN